nr:unnamed protein product [Callosobruchus chinensis]
MIFEKVVVGGHGDVNSNESGIFIYLDLHGHASKKGVFMYGNHFDDVERNVECMLLPKLMSINNHNFHFNGCNFTERNMYLRDKRDGMSRAGSGRVAVLSITGIIKSYTLECNYNTGRLVNVLPPAIKEASARTQSISVPPKYTPHIFEEVGRSLGSSILDLTGHNPFSRLPNSEFHTLNGVREWLRSLQTMSDLADSTSRRDYPKGARLRPSTTGASIGLQSRSSRTKARGAVVAVAAPRVIASKRHQKRPQLIPLDRKENLAAQSQVRNNPRTVPRELHKCFKVKSRKDITLKMKNVEKTTAIPKKRATSSVNLASGPTHRNPHRRDQVHEGCAGVSSSKMKTSSSSTSKPNKIPAKEDGDVAADNAQSTNDCVQLREIRFYKQNQGCKTVVATYENADFDDDSLVVSWKAASRERPRIYTHKSRVLSAPPLGSKMMSDMMATRGKPAGGMRIHTFNKAGTSVFNRPRESALRRLASSTEIEAKVDKKKKKIKKGK